VLLDLVQLDLEVVDLGLDALERVLVLLDVHLGILERLAGRLHLALACCQGRLARRERLGAGAESVAQRPGALMQQVEVAEVLGGRGHRSSSFLGSGFAGDPQPHGPRLFLGLRRPTKKAPDAWASGAWPGGQPVLSRKPSSCRLRTGCWSFRTALASICRTRS